MLAHSTSFRSASPTDLSNSSEPNLTSNKEADSLENSEETSASLVSEKGCALNFKDTSRFSSYDELEENQFEVPDSDFMSKDEALKIFRKNEEDLKEEHKFEPLFGTYVSTPIRGNIENSSVSEVVEPSSLKIMNKQEFGKYSTEVRNPSNQSLSKAPVNIKPSNSVKVVTNEKISTDENQKEGNNIILLASRHISDDERKRLRAKRFNINVASTPNNRIIKKKVPYQDFGTTSTFSDGCTPTYCTLKKRSERFGETVSTVMKDLENKKTMLKRELKFLESVTNFKEREKRRKALEDFDSFITRV